MKVSIPLLTTVFLVVYQCFQSNNLLFASSDCIEGRFCSQLYLDVSDELDQASQLMNLGMKENRFKSIRTDSYSNQFDIGL